MMKSCRGGISTQSLSLFSSDIGAGEFFSYVGNLVSLEQAIAVIGLLSPDFVEHDGHVFWLPTVQQYDPQKSMLSGLVEAETGQLERGFSRRDVERYRNNFSVSQFFLRWESAPDRPVFKVGLSEEDYRLCYIFAEQLKKYWWVALSECFPEKKFEFEIADDLLDEYGVCLTFWQI